MPLLPLSRRCISTQGTWRRSRRHPARLFTWLSWTSWAGRSITTLWQRSGTERDGSLKSVPRSSMHSHAVSCIGDVLIVQFLVLLYDNIQYGVIFANKSCGGIITPSLICYGGPVPGIEFYVHYTVAGDWKRRAFGGGEELPKCKLSSLTGPAPSPPRFAPYPDPKGSRHLRQGVAGRLSLRRSDGFGWCWPCGSRGASASRTVR